MRSIYVLKDPLTNKVVYVGETAKVEQRYKQHRLGVAEDCEEKKEWTARLRRLELRPIMEIIDTAENKRDAVILENKYILKYIGEGCKLFNKKNNTILKQYNLDGVLIGEYVDGKMAKLITGVNPRLDRYTAGGFYWSYGAFDSSVNYKIADAKKVKCKAVVQIDKDGNVVAEFEGVRIACRETGIDHRSIAAVAGGSITRKTAGGYYWKYKEN